MWRYNPGGIHLHALKMLVRGMKEGNLLRHIQGAVKHIYNRNRFWKKMLSSPVKTEQKTTCSTSTLSNGNNVTLKRKETQD
jgi:hypothetical protein